MTDGTRGVVCAVTQNAIERLVGAKLQARQLMQVFRELREIIERCTSAKFDKLGLDDDGILLLKADDLVSQTPQSHETEPGSSSKIS